MEACRYRERALCLWRRLDRVQRVSAGERLQNDSRRRGGDVGPGHGADSDLGVHPCDAAPISPSIVTEPTGHGTTAYLSRPGRRLFMYWRWAHGGLPSHLQDQSPPEGGRARRFGGINVIVRGPGARQIQGRSARSSTAAAPGLPRALPDFPTPRRPLPRGSASSSACYGVPFEFTEAVKVTPPRRPAGGVLYSETDTTTAKPPFPPRAWEPRRVAAASVFNVGAPVEAGPPPPPLAEGVVAAAGPTELRQREAGGGTRAAPGRVPSG